MIRIATPSRLHFGLLAPPSEDEFEDWPDCEGQPNISARHFGGVGLMIKDPGNLISVAPAEDWSVHGPCSDRALSVAKAVCDGLGINMCFHIEVLRCAPEHVGLGTGTQLSMAVAIAVAKAAGRNDKRVADVALLVGRGRRSAVGFHGFRLGGFLVEGGKEELERVSPLVARLPFPDDWSVLLLLPRGLEGNHGPREAKAFEEMSRSKSNLASTDALCRLVLLGMLPALVEQDIYTFSDALYDFNRRVGEMFKPYQGDVYAHPLVARLIGELRSAGIHGVGQSSWGPCVFAIVLSGQAGQLVDWISRQPSFDGVEILVTSGQNHGITLETI